MNDAIGWVWLMAVKGGRERKGRGDIAIEQWIRDYNV